MIILLTGGNGFVGKNLVQRFESKMEIIKGSNDLHIDVLNKQSFEKIEKVDAIIHLAAKTSIPNSISNPYDTYYTNLVGTLNVLEFARKNAINKIINISTYVYGLPSYLPVNEDHPINPHSPYNKSKIISENLSKCYSDDYGIDVVSLRPFYLYGPLGNPNFYIPSIIRQIKEKNEVIVSNKNTKRDFLFIDDFLDLVYKILNNFPKGYNVFNVGYGESHTLEEIILLVGKIIGIKISIRSENSVRPGDITDMVADITKVSKFFDWKPSTDLNTGLRKTLSGYDLILK
ncbi:MAG TPA: SDR family oxidoreductase [Nitrososphaeraceae archaeon]|nr:SDR family oxidoreductase [Nitrososphaeraceae archaeon]